LQPGFEAGGDSLSVAQGTATAISLLGRFESFNKSITSAAI
jgi:hypothetical protein